MNERDSTESGASPRDRASDLQMDACLHELAGVVPDRALTARILDAAAAPRRIRAKRHFATAAAIVMGICVVTAVALLRSDEQSSSAVQPPDPKGEHGNEPDAVDVHLETPAPPAPPAGFTTLIADYSDNRIVEVDENDHEVWVLKDVFGAWDAERLANGNTLLTEFSVSRVREVDRQGKTVWEYEGLKNPYDADRLPNGNTLIADTFGSRVIEVDANKEIVWELREVVDRNFQKTGIRPFDADRLENGNTLIADVLCDRVIEVDVHGNLLWLAPNMKNVHDADRLPNGNTLVTLRQQGRVVELGPTLRLQWQLDGLSSPSDADRLPNGHTLVAENTRVREFDKDGVVVWVKEMTWAVEVNRCQR
ncbi:MAG TPA: hypothetical protein VF384_08225 [Planctomycetota bacterium]